MTSQRPPRVEYRGTGFYASVFVAIVVTVGLLVLAGQNTADVTVEWLWLEITAPLFVWIIGAALTAIVVDELIGLIWRSRERARLSRVPAPGPQDDPETEPEVTTETATTGLAQVAHDYDASRR